MKRLILLAPVLALTACGGPQTPGSRAAHERHEHFEALGKAFKRLGDELKKDAPDLAGVKQNAATIKGAAGQLKTWFPAGSGPQDGVKTHALAEVWNRPDAFGQAATRLTDAAATLNTAAQSGDLAGVRGAFLPLGNACKGCHDRFRQKDD
jgi:cytochrome c556